jgi:ACS family glucarate transporter-like MFS transporter
MKPNAAPAFRVRWRIFSFLFGFGFLAYIQQKTITVAATHMMPDLGLSQLEIGYIEQAFVIGYALFQMPGGVLGQRLGARLTFVIIGLLAFVATIATPIVPEFLSGTALFMALCVAQFALGLSQGAIFPVSAGVFEGWFPETRWAFVQGLQTMGLNFGLVVTPPLIELLTLRFGWRQALIWSSLPTLGFIALWAWYGRNTPREHPSMTEQELAEIGSQPQAHSSINFRQIGKLIADRNVLLLFFSYMCMNYTFYLLSNWVFLYLVQDRHFSSLDGSFLAMVPPLGAAVGAGLGGVAAGLLTQRLGNRWGLRVVPLFAMTITAALLLLAVNSSSAYLALAALTLCFLAVELTEASFWAAGMTVGRGDSMAVCGFMNTGGNLGGIIGIPIVAYFSGLHAWHTAFFIGAGFAVVSAASWLGVRVHASPAAAATTPAPQAASA